MKFNPRHLLAAAIVFCALLTAPAAQAAINYYQVTINTAPLIGDAAGPFSLDFQLNGGGDLANSAVLSNFSFAGGAATGAPTLSGNASGDLSSTISLGVDSSNPFNEFYQSFTPGSSFSFDLALTNNVNSPTPDLFSVGILDQGLLNIPTNGLGNSLATFELNGATATVQVFSAANGVTASAVPEPGTAFFGLTMLSACGYLRRRRA